MRLNAVGDLAAAAAFNLEIAISSGHYVRLQTPVAVSLLHCGAGGGCLRYASRYHRMPRQPDWKAERRPFGDINRSTDSGSPSPQALFSGCGACTARRAQVVTFASAASGSSAIAPKAYLESHCDASRAPPRPSTPPNNAGHIAQVASRIQLTGRQDTDVEEGGLRLASPRRGGFASI